jgi:hypothetical protein
MTFVYVLQEHSSRPPTSLPPVPGAGLAGGSGDAGARGSAVADGGVVGVGGAAQGKGVSFTNGLEDGQRGKGSGGGGGAGGRATPLAPPPTPGIDGYVRTPHVLELGRVGNGGGGKGGAGKGGGGHLGHGHGHGQPGASRRRECVTLWRDQPVFPARPGFCKYMLLGGPLHEHIKFPWLKGPTQNTDSLFEVVRSD